MRCFVIMPYGRTEQEKKEYTRLYKLIIKSAVEDLDIECVRSDIEGKGGHILSNVIDDISESDIVIADISALNWNVAYELGIRHALHKGGTILICNDETELPFDIQSLNIFLYPKDWLDKMEELCDNLKKVIQNRLSNPDHCDSPVHERYSFLPTSIINGFSESTGDEVKVAKARIQQLERELSETYSKIENMGLSLSNDNNDAQVVDYSQIFISELANSIYNGEEAVAKLRELLEEGDKEEFLKFLSKVLTVGFIDEGNCRTIYLLCKRLNLPAVTRNFLEAASKFYPENEEIAGFLANEYSKNYHTGEKAIQMVNGIIGVSKKDGEFVLAKSPRITSTKLAAFFDVYLHLKKYSDLIEVGKLLCKRFDGNKKICSVVLRNMVISSIYLEDLESAGKYKDLLLEIDPMNDMTHYVCYRYADACEDYVKVVEEIETCIRLDDDDADYYISMAGYICDNLYARDPDTMEIRQISPKDADQFAVPFLITAITLDRGAITRVVDFLRRNKFGTYLPALVDAFQTNVTNFRSAFPDLDYGAVDYCLGIN